MPTTRIIDVATSTKQQWDYFVDHCEYATYFHTHEWAELWNSYFEGTLKPEAKCFNFSDGLKVLLPLSVSRSAKGLISQYTSSSTGKYGGWLSDRHLSKTHVLALWTYISKLNIVLRQNPYDVVLATLDIPWSKRDFTQVLDLRKGFDAVHRKWTKGHSSAARKAHRAGVIVEEANGLNDWEEYFSVYENSVKRWGKNLQSRYRWKLFEIMQGQHSKKIKLWLAKYAGAVASGAICFYQNKHVVYWHGAALEEYFKLGSGHLLQYEIIKDCCRKDYWWYDFNPSGGLKGTVAFKNSFGCEQKPSNIYAHSTLLVRSWKRLLSSIPVRAE